MPRLLVSSDQFPTFERIPRAVRGIKRLPVQENGRDQLHWQHCAELQSTIPGSALILPNRAQVGVMPILSSGVQTLK